MTLEQTRGKQPRRFRGCSISFSVWVLVSLATSGWIAAQPLAGSYVIDSETPTGGNNFQSFSDAVIALSMFGVSASVTFNVAAGSGPYVEHIYIPEINGTGPTSKITFNGNGRTLRFGPSSTDYSIIDLNGVDYITINDLVIVGTNVTYGVGVLLRNQSNYNHVTNCIIDLGAITSTSTVSACIAASGSVTSVSLAGNNANHCSFEGNVLTGSPGGGPYYGIRLNGTSDFPLMSNSIINNSIKDFYSYGIYLYHTCGTTVRGNDISRPSRTFLSTFYGIYCAIGSKSDVIEKNRIHDPCAGAPTFTGSMYGLFFNSPSTPSGSETTVKNNLIYNMQGMGSLYGAYCILASNVRIYHNTFSLDNESAVAGNTYGLYISGTTVPGPDIRNNIVTVMRGGLGVKYCIYVSGAGALSSNYNDLYMNAPEGTNYTGYYNGVPYTTLLYWQTANLNVYDQHSVAVDPSYEATSSGNYRALAAGVNNVGDNLSTSGCFCVTDDILGFIRCANPDLGAYEYTLSPVAITCPTNIIVNTDLGSCTALVSFSAMATGIPAPTISYYIGGNPISSPYTFPKGISTVTATSTNSCGTATCTFTVQVNDTELPTITCPPNILINTDPCESTAIVTWAALPASDNCGAPTVVCVPASGSTFDIGSTTVTCSATDGSLNTASCSFTVTVNGPVENILDIIDDVTSLVDASILNEGNGNSLMVKLTGAIDKFNDDQYDQAMNKLEAFINEVTAFINTGKLTVSQGEALIEQANTVIDQLSGCTPPPIINNSAAIPYEYALEQNFPNPFNSSTTITYGIPEDGMVILRVFDLHGRMVSELVNEMKTNGTYSVEFNASNLPSGIYLYRLEANERVLTGTMTHMR